MWAQDNFNFMTIVFNGLRWFLLSKNDETPNCVSRDCTVAKPQLKMIGKAVNTKH